MRSRPPALAPISNVAAAKPLSTTERAQNRRERMRRRMRRLEHHLAAQLVDSFAAGDAGRDDRLPRRHPQRAAEIDQQRAGPRAMMSLAARSGTARNARSNPRRSSGVGELLDLEFGVLDFDGAGGFARPSRTGAARLSGTRASPAARPVDFQPRRSHQLLLLAVRVLGALYSDSGCCASIRSRTSRPIALHPSCMPLAAAPRSLVR